MIELTLYGHRCGRPNTAMSVCPSTWTSCCRYTISVVARCTASTSPAWTDVMACGALIDWKIDRGLGGGSGTALVVAR